jgi:glutaredoxin
VSDQRAAAPDVGIVYRFRLGDGSVREFEIRLDPVRYSMRREATGSPPPWAVLEFHKCPHCPLDPATTAHCPPAAALAPVIESFRQNVSFEEVDLEVTTPSREIAQRTSLQRALSSLVGLIMASSGCPVLDKLRPMVATHLPLATADEATIRILSTYLVAQLVRARDGLEPDWSLEHMVEFFGDVAAVNRAFSRRLNAILEGDANVNALVILNDLSALAELAIESESLARLRETFFAHR